MPAALAAEAFPAAASVPVEHLRACICGKATCTQSADVEGRVWRSCCDRSFSALHAPATDHLPQIRMYTYEPVGRISEQSEAQTCHNRGIGQGD